MNNNVSLITRNALSGWFKAGSYAVLLFFVYQQALTYLYGKWQTDDFSYCYVVPPILLYLLWDERQRLAKIPSAPSWKAFLLLVPGLFLFWIGELGGEYTLQFLSLWLVVIALCWLHLGWDKLKVIAFPLAFSLAVFVPPNAVYLPLTFRLKLISSQLGVQLIQLYGLSAYREGNIIDLGFTQLQVVDACSGLRYVIPLFLMGILMAYYFRGSLWKRVLLVLSTIPISIVTNSLRIASVGILYQYWGAAAAEGFLHDFSGWFIFMSGLVFLLLEMLVLKKLFPEKARALKSADTERGALPDPRIRPVAFFPILRFPAAAMALVLTFTVVQLVSLHGETPVLQPLGDFPLHLGDWRGNRTSMEQQFLEVLKLSDYTLIDYRDPGGKEVSFYVAYNNSQSKGEATHSPATCLPGSGWEFRESGVAELSGLGKAGTSIRVSRAYMEKNGTRQLTYYWFPQRGRVLTNLYQVKLFNFWDALVRQRTDGALVRVITPLYPDEKTTAAEERIRSFTRRLVPVLDDFLPGTVLR